MARATRTLAILFSVALAAGCSVKDAPSPTLTGPSELSLSLVVSASPDTLSQDGSAQALVVVLARDVNGRAVPNLSLRFDVVKDGAIVDYGSLSSKTGLTGSDGRAQVTYTAPPLPANSSAIQASVVSVVATPVSTNYASSFPRTVDIHLVPPGQIPPPGSGAAAAFTYVWSGTPGPGVSVGFDASSSSSPAGIVTYAWDYGDGTTGTGVVTQHAFASPGTYAVKLTVTDKKGQTAWTTQTVTVAAGPTALFTWSPTAPIHGAAVTFDAANSWAMPPAAIVTYTWDFGDGWSGSGVSAFHVYAAAGTYAVKLSVTDSNGLVGRLTLNVTVQ